MATLFNTRIFETYQGLIKTIDNAVITASLKELTDGSGNQTGLYINTTGDFKVTNVLEWGSLKDTGTGVIVTRYVTSTDGIENFDNNTSLPTTAAVKLYVDTKFATSDTLQEVLSFGNTTSGNDIAVSASDDITFTTTSKIIMGPTGAAGNLQIYNDGSNSYISENGAGDLRISTNAAQVAIQNSLSENMARFIVNNKVILYYDNVQKFETTNTGISVVGVISNVTDPTAAQDAATKSYVDGLDAGSDLDITDGTTAGAVNLNTQSLSILGTTNEIDSVVSGQSVTIGLPTSISTNLVGSVTGNVTGNVQGDLTGTVNATSILADGVTATTQASSDDSTKVATTAYVKGLDNASDLDFSGDSGTGDVNLNTQSLAITGTANQIQSTASNQGLSLQFPTAGITLPDGSVATTQSALDNSTKVATTSYVDTSAGLYLPLVGGIMSGNTIHNNSVKSIYGTSSDAEIYHDGSDFYAKNTTGNLYIDQAAVTESIFFRVSDANALDVTALTISRNGDLTTGRDVTIAGDLTVNGTTTTVNSQTLSVVDPLIQLAKDNTANSLDIGLYGDYNDGTDRFLGLFSDASDGNKFKLFKGTTVEPTTTVDIGGAGYVAADLQVAGLEATTGTFTGITSTNELLWGNGFANGKLSWDTGYALIQGQTGNGIKFQPNAGTALTLNTSGNAAFSGDVSLPDLKSLILGTGSDLKLFHNVTDSFIVNETGNLKIVNGADDKDIIFESDNGSGGTTTYLKIDSASQAVTFVKPAYLTDNVKAFFGNSSDLQIYHDSANSYIQTSTGSSGDLYIQSQGTGHDLYLQATDDILIRPQGGNNGIKVIGQAAVELYYNNVKKFETTAGGTINTGTIDSTGTITVTGANGNVGINTDTGKLLLGASYDLQIYHDGSNSYIKDAGTGALFLETDYFRLVNLSAAQSMISANTGGSVILYYAGGEKLATTSTGIDVSGTSSTFAGDVNITQTADVGVLNTTNLEDGSAVGLSLTYPTSNVAGGDGLAIAIGITGRGRSYIANSNTSTNLDASNLEFYTEGGGAIVKALTLDQNTNAIFNGNVAINTGGASPDRTLDVRGNGLSIYGSGNGTELMLRGQVEGSGTIRDLGAFHLSIRSDVSGDNDDLKFLRFTTGTFGGVALQLSNTTGDATFEGYVKAPFFTTDGGRGFKQNGVAFVSTYSNGAAASNANDLGSPTNVWRDAYMGNKIYGSNISPAFTFASDVNTGMSRTGTHQIGFVNNSVVSLTLDALARATFSTSVGIGVAPDRKLHIGSAGDSNIRMENTNTAIVSGDNYGQIEWEGNDINTSANGIRASIQVKGYGAGTQGETAMYFRTSYIGADSNQDRMVINHLGDIGIGTDTPVSKLEVKVIDADRTSLKNVLTITANGTNGPYTGHGGKISFNSNIYYGTTTPGIIETAYIGAVLGSLYETDSDLVFGTRRSTTTVAEQMRLTGRGNLYLGSNSVNPTNGFRVSQVEGGTFVQIEHPVNTSTGSDYAIFRYNQSIIGTIRQNGTSQVQYNVSSDYRLKEDLKDFLGLELVSKIPVYDYKWKSSEDRSYGVMAHELQEVLPDAVSGEKDAEEMQGVDYSKIVPLLVKSIQELTAKVEMLEKNCQCKN